MKSDEITNIHEDIVEILIDRLRENPNNALIYYSDLCEMIDNQVDCRHISNFLGDISIWCNEIDAPMLSVLVINKNNNQPGNGFYNLYAYLNNMSSAEKLDKDEVFIKEYKKVICYKDWDKLMSYLGI